ncbi:orotidine-5'-phosphate decarboxylase [Chthonomonas calidirosea]|uniref:orotidine-5'-phosphate decarboxylase n=1 Tax=Chthonomonas calidirosea TaxID=454171 RepID=UPI0006DD4F26|nr:orotidine-5'-phosphate decarboxylase [Chthonomonas calidirosea]CEK12455.1 orotidine-5'-phosphate decarboxylase [Chthonomonas calidirosea]
MSPRERIICALDVPNADVALRHVERLREHVGVFKVGLELLMAEGPSVVPRLQAAGAKKIFLDVKLHDIPNTVVGAVRKLACLGVWAITLHTFGGSKMLEAAYQAALEAAQEAQREPPLLLGVTVLTSLSPAVLKQELRIGEPMEELVVHLARLAFQSGCGGVVASPQELVALRAAFPDPSHLFITPGVRPALRMADDQARTLTPAEAVRRGASYLVIGRPILTAQNPVEAAQRIAEEIQGALEES